ncbi:hypothetical protein CHIBA101_1019 [Actinomyces sp. Chiba101]|uniref:DUF6318 family protein n=1 Tax=Actinomyces TaxID=1654 RepID=UPI000974DBFD|nr:MULTISPECIES: DUF6318 family protein [Actinomyces]BAW92884.1 hypothetical protein CHIBA101_1019 [Actinomyces sp. Chiba101]GAV94137.1 hypothetical protein ADENT20671_0905 [Actinomyces denticolens]SUU06442.1 Uncharacterised protein [Actinomyces denticolens]
MAPVSCRSPVRAVGAVVLRRRRSSGPAPGRWRRGLEALRRRWALPVALTLLACCAPGPGLLAACANDAPAPEVSGTLPTRFFSTPEASTTATPTTSAGAPVSLGPELAAQRATALAEPKPVKPPEASENTQQGAVNAVVHFFNLYRYAFITGDTTDLAAMSEESCVFCQSAIDNATKLHEGGGWANPWDITIQDISYTPPGAGKEHSAVQGNLVMGASTTINSAGEPTEEGNETARIFVVLRYSDGEWIVRGVSVE